MSLFKPADNSMAFFKAGFMGEAGSGKTHTATLAMIGLVQHLKKRGIAGSNRPVYMLDTEQGSAWIKPMFDEAGIPLMVAKTRAFKDLVPAVRDAERNASGLFIDSITHFWEDLQNSYMNQRGRTRLEFQDWAVLKKMWRTFSDAYVNSELHCILCGRLGFEYETVEDDRGKKQIEKSGVKMQAEKSLGYEPNILVWMERDTDLVTKKVTRTATVLKDRSQRLDGQQYPNPTFATFLPHIEFLSLGGKHETVDTSRTSEDVIPDDDAPMQSDMKSIRRQIVIDEIQALMVKHYPSTTAEDKKAKAALLVTHFKTTSWTEVERLMPLFDLQANFDAMHVALEGKPSRYGQQVAPQPVIEDIDEIPHMDAPPAVAQPAVEPIDTTLGEKALDDLQEKFKAVQTLAAVKTVWTKFETELLGSLSNEQQQSAKNMRAAAAIRLSRRKQAQAAE